MTKTDKSDWKELRDWAIYRRARLLDLHTGCVEWADYESEALLGRIDELNKLIEQINKRLQKSNHKKGDE